jgi:hypothetical protein
MPLNMLWDMVPVEMLGVKWFLGKILYTHRKQRLPLQSSHVHIRGTRPRKGPQTLGC